MNTIRTSSPTEDLAALRGQKGHTCVSIIVPTHNQLPDHQIDEVYMAQAVQRAVYLLHLSYPEEAENLTASVLALATTIDFNHTLEGLGLYISDEVQQIVHFPFPVTKKVVVDKRFEIRDLLYKMAFSKPYYLLHLEEEKATLYYGVLQHLEAIKDQNFPCIAVNDYDYQHPVRGSAFTGRSYIKSLEEDKGELQKIRYHSFLSNVDDLLSDYLTKDTLIIICGMRPITAAFLNQSIHDTHIISVLNGNYANLGTKELADLVAPIIEASLEEKMKDEISRLEELGTQGLTEEGFQNVRQAVIEGRGQKLFVEKDYPHSDLPFHEKNLHTHKDLWGYVTAEEVEALIEEMLEKKGQVLLVGKDMLKDYGHIALITRY